MSCRRTGSILAFVLTACVMNAQVVLHSDAIAFSGTTSKNVVRDSAGTLFCVSIAAVAGTNPLVIQSSTDGGANWVVLPVTLNDATSGLSGTSTTLTNTCAVAIDDQDTLHVTWGAYYYPTNFRQF